MRQTPGIPALFVRALQTAVDFSEQISAKIFGDDAGRSQFAAVGNGQLRKIRQDRGERGSWMPDESKPNVVGEGPFAVTNDAVNDIGVESFAR